MNFVVGNENGKCYTFDLRKPETAKLIHKDHHSAILDIDFAPLEKNSSPRALIRLLESSLTTMGAPEKSIIPRECNKLTVFYTPWITGISSLAVRTQISDFGKLMLRTH